MLLKGEKLKVGKTVKTEGECFSFPSPNGRGIGRGGSK